MSDSRKNKSKNPYKAFFIKLGALFIILVLIFLAIADVKVYKKKRELDAQVLNLQNKIQDLKDKNSQLKEGTARANDDAYIEKIAREELDLQMPGEKVFSFVRAPGQAPPPAEPKNIWQAWAGSGWNSFVGLFRR